MELGQRASALEARGLACSRGPLDPTRSLQLANLVGSGQGREETGKDLHAGPSIPQN
jgi:hypothetical protein